MSRRLLALRVDGNIVVVRGWKAAGTLRSAGLRATFSGAVGGWMVDTGRLPELLAWLDDRRIAYALEGDDRAITAQPRAAAPVVEAEPEQEGLW